MTRTKSIASTGLNVVVVDVGDDKSDMMPSSIGV